MIAATQWADAYGKLLLEGLGADHSLPPELIDGHPADWWHGSGLQTLTGTADKAGQMIPLPLAACANGALQALSYVSPQSLAGISGAALCTERAALMGLHRNGRIAAGGACRLIDTSDGRLAVNLPRDDDWEMLPAWLEFDDSIAQGDWISLEAQLRKRHRIYLADRAAEMGLAVGLDQPLVCPESWFQSHQLGEPDKKMRPPLVLDLSSLWAGPLCTHLLQQAGARVIKIESTRRPDGARKGDEGFFDLLNAGKACVSVDLTDQDGLRVFGALLEQADIVVESARPRALRQLGLDAEELVGARPGLTWLGITAYGREGANAERIGFGDDVGVAAGLTRIMADITGEAMFVGDAIADPLTGIHAALAAMAAYKQGGGRLLSLSMREVTAHCAAFMLPEDADALQCRHHEWSMRVEAESARIPAARKPDGRAHALGQDTESVLSEFALN